MSDQSRIPQLKIWEISPIVAAVVNPLPHHGVVSVQVDGDVLVLRIQHVAEFLQSTVLWAAAGGVPQVVHDVRHVHFTCNAAGTGETAEDRLTFKMIRLWCFMLIQSVWSGSSSAPGLRVELYLLCLGAVLV